MSEWIKVMELTNWESFQKDCPEKSLLATRDMGSHLETFSFVQSKNGVLLAFEERKEKDLLLYNWWRFDGDKRAWKAYHMLRGENWLLASVLSG